MKRLQKNLWIPNIVSAENKKPTIILLLAPVLLVTWRYYGSASFYLEHISEAVVLFQSAAMTAEWYTYFSAFFLLGIIPLLVVRYSFRESSVMYNMGIGDWKFGLASVVVIGSVMAVLGFVSSRNPQFLLQYPLYKNAGTSLGAFALHSGAYLFFYIGWEIFFRGWMQSGLTPRFGAWGAVLVQTALSCIVHIGKPDGEIYSAILGGIVWGVVVYRSRSIWPAIATHWILGVSLDYCICFTR